MVAYIRRMEARDVEAVSHLLSTSWRSTYGPLMGEARAIEASARIHAPELLQSELENDGSASFVAEDATGSPVGYAYAFRKGGEVVLERLHVAQASQGTGLAADLLHAVFASFTGDRQVMLEVLEGNVRAIHFYRKHGFAVSERRDACGGVEGVPTVIMRRVLSSA
jgi:ribosomal protein S18 acetylase RimI-like enzyme